MKLLASPAIPVGRVYVVEDGVCVVEGGRLSDLQRVAGDEPETTEIYVNPADVDVARARWFEQGRLN